MTPQGDTKRPRSVKLEIDPDFCATAQAGGVLVEQTLRRLGLCKILKQHLPARAAQAAFAAHDFAYQAIAALLLGGDGIDVMAPLRADRELRKIFGLDQAASDATTYRILCELAGLQERAFADAYGPAGPIQERLDMFGGLKTPAAHRRLVPETPEAARRWREAGELPGVWHYSFLASNLEPGALPRALTRKHGAAGALWMLYATKQGQENHFKTPLRDLALHHPPSGRLGVSQVYYALASMAANIAMVMRYEVAPAGERGMTLERLRRCFFAVAGYVVQSGRRLVVRLAGAALDRRRQGQLLEAYANARRL